MQDSCFAAEASTSLEVSCPTLKWGVKGGSKLKLKRLRQHARQLRRQTCESANQVSLVYGSRRLRTITQNPNPCCSGACLLDPRLADSCLSDSHLATSGLPDSCLTCRRSLGRRWLRRGSLVVGLCVVGFLVAGAWTTSARAFVLRDFEGDRLDRLHVL